MKILDKIPYWLQIVLALIALAAVIYFTGAFDWLFDKDEFDNPF